MALVKDSVIDAMTLAHQKKLDNHSEALYCIEKLYEKLYARDVRHGRTQMATKEIKKILELLK